MERDRLALLLAFSAGTAAAQGAPDPLAFVNRIYAAEMAGKRPDGDMRNFAPALATLLRCDAAISRRTGEPNLIDEDIVCACQDDDGLRAVPTLVDRTATAATVRVKLAFSGRHPQAMTIKLARSGGDWRIADTVTPGLNGGSLVARLRAGLR